MMETLWDSLQPIVTVVVKDVITFIAAGALIAYGLLKTKILSFIKNEMLHRVASEGFSLAEANFKELSGSGKFNKAFAYTSDKLGRIRIKVTEEEIKAAIEKACLEYNSKKKVEIKKAS